MEIYSFNLDIKIRDFQRLCAVSQQEIIAKPLMTFIHTSDFMNFDHLLRNFAHLRIFNSAFGQSFQNPTLFLKHPNITILVW